MDFGGLLRKPVFQFAGTLSGVFGSGFFFLYKKIDSLVGQIRTEMIADRQEASADRRQMQATLNELLRRRWWQ